MHSNTAIIVYCLDQTLKKSVKRTNKKLKNENNYIAVLLLCFTIMADSVMPFCIQIESKICLVKGWTFCMISNPCVLGLLLLKLLFLI